MTGRRRGTAARWASCALLLSALLWAPAVHAAPLRYCDQPAALSASQQDTLLRFAALVRAELEASGARAALVSRSGLDLSRFGVRYSHAGIALAAAGADDPPWSVRQLYFACDEQRPKLFDQGLSGFVLGVDDPSVGYVSIVFLPAAEAAALERLARDKRQALQLLGADYSANAYPFSLRYQNCNQWVMEMLATAWDAPPGDTEPSRLRAQRWLVENRYAPTVFEVGGLMGLSPFIPWVHSDDHPAEDIDRRAFRVSMPASIEAFVRATVPGATRIELCHAGTRVVVRRGWDAIAEGCMAGERDAVVALE